MTRIYDISEPGVYIFNFFLDKIYKKKIIIIKQKQNLLFLKFCVSFFTRENFIAIELMHSGKKNKYTVTMHHWNIYSNSTISVTFIFIIQKINQI